MSALSWKAKICQGKFGKKTYFELKILVSIRFNRFFTTNQVLNQKNLNVSDFEPTFNISSKLEWKILERVGLWNNLLNIQQNIKRKFYNASDFEGKLFVENKKQWKIRFKKINSFGSSHKKNHRTTKMAFPWFLWKQKSEKIIEKEKHFLDQFFWEDLGFESLFITTRQKL